MKKKKMSLFIQYKTLKYSDLVQSYYNSMHSSNDYLFFDHIFCSRTYRVLGGFYA